jgi:hypothetical protein
MILLSVATTGTLCKFRSLSDFLGVLLGNGKEYSNMDEFMVTRTMNQQFHL